MTKIKTAPVDQTEAVFRNPPTHHDRGVLPFYYSRAALERQDYAEEKYKDTDR